MSGVEVLDVQSALKSIRRRVDSAVCRILPRASNVSSSISNRPSNISQSTFGFEVNLPQLRGVELGKLAQSFEEREGMVSCSVPSITRLWAAFSESRLQTAPA